MSLFFHFMFCIYTILCSPCYLRFYLFNNERSGTRFQLCDVIFGILCRKKKHSFQPHSYKLAFKDAKHHWNKVMLGLQLEKILKRSSGKTFVIKMTKSISLGPQFVDLTGGVRAWVTFTEKFQHFDKDLQLLLQQNVVLQSFELVGLNTTVCHTFFPFSITHTVAVCKG